jgi:hypothetical protein
MTPTINYMSYYSLIVKNIHFMGEKKLIFRGEILSLLNTTQTHTKNESKYPIAR